MDRGLQEPSVIGQRDQFRAQFLKSQAEIPNRYGDPTVSNTSLLAAVFTHFSENLSSKGVTEDHEIGLMFPTAVEGKIEITWRDSVDRLDDCSSDKDVSSTEDVDEDTDDLPGDHA